MSEVLSFRSTGSYALDCALGGGLLVGRISDVYGTPEDVGAVAMGAMRAAQETGCEVAYLDCSDTLDAATVYAAGVTHQRLLVSTPSTEEHAMEIAEICARSGVALIVIAGVFFAPADPLGPLFTHQARTVSSAVRGLESICRKSGSHALFLRGLRADGTRPVGGNASKFYAAQRVQVTRCGPMLTATVSKNEAAPAGAAARIRLIRESLTANG